MLDLNSLNSIQASLDVNLKDVNDYKIVLLKFFKNMFFYENSKTTPSYMNVQELAH